MQVSHCELLMLLRVLEGSLTIADRTDMNIFGYPKKSRSELYVALMQRLDKVPVEIGKDDTHHPKI